MKKIIIVIVLIGGTLLYAFMAKKNLETQVSTGPAPESLLTTLPDVSFVTLEGEEYKTLPMMKASGTKLVLVHFWATWCGPCEAELPELFRFLGSLPNPQDVQVLLIAVSDEVPKIMKFIAKQKPSVQNKIVWLLDNRGTHRAVYNTTKLPESYIFRTEGRFLRKLVGPQEWQKPMFLDMFQALLP